MPVWTGDIFKCLLIDCRPTNFTDLPYETLYDGVFLKQVHVESYLSAYSQTTAGALEELARISGNFIASYSVSAYKTPNRIFRLSVS